MKIDQTAASGSIQQTVQIEMMKKQIDVEKHGVMELYKMLEGLKPAPADAYIPSSAGTEETNGYKP